MNKLFEEIVTDTACNSQEIAERLNEQHAATFIEELKVGNAIIYRYPYKPVKISSDFLNHIRKEIYGFYCQWVYGGQEWKQKDFYYPSLEIPDNLSEKEIRNYLLNKYKTIGDWAEGEESYPVGPQHDIYCTSWKWAEAPFRFNLSDKEADTLIEECHFDWSIMGFQMEIERYCYAFLTSDAWDCRIALNLEESIK